MISLLLFGLLAQVPQAAPADPLAPAREGKIQCVGPNLEKKTCSATTLYMLYLDGAYQGMSVMVLSPAPLITMRFSSEGTVKDGKVCETIRAENFKAATFQADDAPLGEPASSTVRTQVLSGMAPFIGKTACSVVKPEGDMLLSVVTIDGIARPELNQRFIWVDKDAGYRLGQ